MNIYHLALTMIGGLGNKGLRKLIEIIPDVEKVYELSHSQLKELFGSHEGIISAIERKSTVAEAEKAYKTLEEKHIRPLFITDADYPQRLRREGCGDCPALLYMLGTCNLNPEQSISIVGSRKATDYGRAVTQRLVSEMAEKKPTIVSGLAYGIDTAAHTASVQYGLPTIGVLGHGLDRIYPAQNRNLARQILQHGGALLTEYPLGTAISASNFPARNRIIAALSDATVVVEAAEHGGALITANMASGYMREVFAVPGNLDAPYSAGCNNLITNNKAILIRNAGDLYFQMGWHPSRNLQSQQSQQKELFATFNKEEQLLADLLRQHREMTLDEMVAESGMSMPKTASIVIGLEMKNCICCLPGKKYKLV